MSRKGSKKGSKRVLICVQIGHNLGPTLDLMSYNTYILGVIAKIGSRKDPILVQKGAKSGNVRVQIRVQIRVPKAHNMGHNTCHTLGPTLDLMF